MTNKPIISRGHIRIIGGQWRGRKLPVPQVTGLRPTTDRLKETLFNWLQFELADRRVLDIFAGTASLGIEALSRGASHATFFEQNAQAAKQIQANLTLLQATAIGTVRRGNALALLAETPNQAYDLVFIDPPFHQELLNQTIAALTQQAWLAKGAFIYLESEAGVKANIPQQWQLHREKKMGQSLSQLYLLT